MGPRGGGAVHRDEEPWAVTVAGADHGAGRRPPGAGATLADGAPLPAPALTQGQSHAHKGHRQLKGLCTDYHWINYWHWIILMP